MLVENTESTVKLSSLEERARRVLGIHEVYGHVYELLGFTNLFKWPARRKYAADLLKEMVLARIANPRSKRGSVRLIENYTGKKLNLDHIYQMMDKVESTLVNRVQAKALGAALNLTGEQLRVLFYDATTLYFESFTEDALKQNGYSKDMKFNQPQILLTLFVTNEGLPVGYEVYSGSTFEGHTLIPTLEQLQKRYGLEEVVIVADRGLLSEKNLAYLESHGYRYIVGSRLKSLTRTNQEKVQMWASQAKQKADSVEAEVATGRIELKKGRSVILSYHAGRAKKDRHDREKALEKLRVKLSKSKNPKGLISNFGYQKYIRITGESTVTLDEKKLEQASKWDGLSGVVTNKPELADETILQHYRSLWQIEESFRINKHDLRMRPIYHWSPERVKAHLLICFMAFVCVRFLEYRVKLQHKKLSPEVIRGALIDVQGSIITNKESGNEYLLRSQGSSEAKGIYRVLGLKLPTGVCETN